jgi:hypothetical protein
VKAISFCKVFFSTVFILGICVCKAGAQQGFPDDGAYDRLRAVIPSIVSMLRPILSAREVEILSQTRIAADPERLTNAAAFRDRTSGQRRIVIYTGLSSMMETVSQVMAANMNDDCTVDFLEYFYDLWANNTDRVRRRLPLAPPPRYKTISEYFSGRGDCRDISQAIANPSQEYSARYSNFMYGSLILVLLHELGHHVLGHVDRSVERQNGSRQFFGNLQKDEDAADKWALKTMRQTPYSVLDATPLFWHLLETGLSFEYDIATATHSSGQSRFSRLFDELIDENKGDSKLISQLEEAKIWLLRSEETNQR